MCTHHGSVCCSCVVVLSVVIVLSWCERLPMTYHCYFFCVYFVVYGQLMMCVHIMGACVVLCC